MLKLYSHWRSSCSFRVRIALNLKGLKYEYKAVNLRKGEQFSAVFRREVSSAASIFTSGYSEKSHQLPGCQYSFLKHTASSKCCYTEVIEEKLGPNAQLAWAKHHVEKGFIALERLLKDHAGRFATGDEIYLADLFLAPQIYAAFTRFNVGKTQFPILSRLHEAYNEIPAFQDAMPEKQPDAPLISTS